jgi:hypothetical protein
MSEEPHPQTAPGDGPMLIAVLSNALYGVLSALGLTTLPVWEQLFQAVATIVLDPDLGCRSDVGDYDRQYPAHPLRRRARFASGTAVLDDWHQQARGRATHLRSTLLPIIVALLAWLILGEQLHRMTTLVVVRLCWA